MNFTQLQSLLETLGKNTFFSAYLKSENKCYIPSVARYLAIFYQGPDFSSQEWLCDMWLLIENIKWS